MEPGAETRTPASSSTAPGPLLLATSLALLAGFAGWWSRGELAEQAPAAPAAPAEQGPEDDGAAPVADPAAAPVAAGAAGQPDIVLVTVGGLRADHVGPLSGYERPTMPWVSELAKQKGQSFRAAVAPSSWSLPSAASVLTGVPPSTHGLLRPPRAAGGGKLEVPVLPESVGTLAERLQRAGYQTRAVVADPALQRATGLGRGFDEFLNIGAARAQRVQEFVERLGVERKKVDRPLFAWIHYGDPTAPYQANPWAFWWGPADPGSGEEPPPDAELPRLARLGAAELAATVKPGPMLTAAATLYDSELRLIDDHVQLLWGDLGVDDGDVVVITGLHGEELADHGGFGHGHALHEELLRVPLVISWPARWPQPQRIAEGVALTDLMPTLAELAGAPFRLKGKVPSRSLVPLIENQDRPRGAPVVAELGSRCRAVYDGALKRVERAGEAAVYDLDADPREASPLPPDHPGAQALRAAAERGSVATVATTTVDIADAVIAQLATAVPGPSPCD